MKLLILFILIINLHANSIHISGIYKGYTSNPIKNNISIQIENINPKSLSSYKDIFPLTGGNRVMMYFDTNGDKKANICGYMYKKVMVLYRASTSGFHNIHIGYIPIVHIKNKTHITIPTEYLKDKIYKIWTYKDRRN